jgi:hypothetical protein
MKNQTGLRGYLEQRAGQQQQVRVGKKEWERRQAARAKRDAELAKLYAKKI